MNDHEGSVMTEDSDVEETQESEETTEAADAAEQESEDSTDASEQTEESKATEKTDKGTKLDPNPQSQMYQRLANAERAQREYEALLNDPTRLKKYLAELEPDEKQGEEEIREEDIQTEADLKKYLKQQNKKIENWKKEQEVRESKRSEQIRATEVSNRIQSDITTVRTEYPELNPKHPKYNPDLDRAVGDIYNNVDFDQLTGTYRGQVSIKTIADNVMKAAGVSKKQGSQEAQTIVRDRRTGKTISGASQQSIDESKMSARQLIASRMARASKR